MTTVVSARPWEEELARVATHGAQVRLVARVDGPLDLVARLAHTDVFVVGSETPWIEPWVFTAAKAFGVDSIGIHPRGDRPGVRLLAEATLSFPEDIPAEHLICSAAVLGVRL